MRIDLYGLAPLSTKIVHVDLNDETLNDPVFKTGSADYLADTVKTIADAGAKAVILDFFFDGRSSQDKLIEVSMEYRIVYYPMILRVDESNPNGILKASQALLPIEGLRSSAKGIGHINIKRDQDGVIRNYPLVISYKNKLVPSMALRTAMDYFKIGMENIQLKNGYLKLLNAVLPDGSIMDINIPVNKHGELKINFTGSWFEVFPHYSMKKILSADEEQFEELYNELENTIVVISDTSTWGKDFGTTPLAQIYPLSGIHSNVLNNIINREFIYDITIAAKIAITLAVWILMVLIADFRRLLPFIMLTAGLLVFIYIGVVYSFIHYSCFIPAAVLFASVIASFIVVQSLRYLSEQWQKRLLIHSFSGYFSKSLMDKIIHTPQMINNVEEKSLAVLFSDIAGFTSWSSTRDPETIRNVLNEYFSKMASIVFKYNGTIDKYIGDGLMVFFGDPETLENPSKNAIQAALEMQRSCEELRELWKDSGKMDIHIRIGINYGDVVVGNMGSKQRMDYTVLGSHVNLAQRLESNAPVDGILISEAVYNEVKGLTFNIEKHTDIKAKGFDNLIKTYTVSS